MYSTVRDIIMYADDEYALVDAIIIYSLLSTYDMVDNLQRYKV